MIPFAPYGSAIIAWTQKTLHPLVKSNKADVAAVTGASVTSKAIEQAVEVALAKATGKSLKAKFKPGTYKSQAYGNNGYLNVEVTVTKDKIKSIKVPANQETPFMGGMAIKSISDDIVRYQMLEDGVAFTQMRA